MKKGGGVTSKDEGVITQKLLNAFVAIWLSKALADLSKENEGLLENLNLHPKKTKKVFCQALRNAVDMIEDQVDG